MIANPLPDPCETRTKARVLLSIQIQLLSNLLRSLLSAEPDVEIVGEVSDPVDLLIAAGQTQADVVIQCWPSDEMPGICSHLLAAFPDLTVIGIGDEGESNFACRRPIVVNHLSPPGLRSVQSVIREALAEVVPLRSWAPITSARAAGICIVKH